MSNAAEKNGQPCARCGLKDGAHFWPNRHPKACSEWVTAYDLERERDEYLNGWMLDANMEDQS